MGAEYSPFPIVEAQAREGQDTEGQWVHLEPTGNWPDK